MLSVEYTSQFKRDIKLAKKRHKNLVVLENIMADIASQKTLNDRLKDHSLTGNFSGYRELHIEPDWLLVYKLIPKEKIVVFFRTGSHSDLFK